MDPNNPFDISYAGPDAPSSGNPPDYAPSPYIQQEQQPEQRDGQQNTTTSSNTDVANPLGLAFETHDDPPNNSRPSFNFSRPLQAQQQQPQQQRTIMSSHTDPNPSDIPDNDFTELERLRNRFHNHENKLKIMETPNERDAVPGGRIAWRILDYLSEDEGEDVGMTEMGAAGRVIQSGRYIDKIYARQGPPRREDGERARRGGKVYGYAEPG